MTASKVAEHFRLCPDSPSYVAWARDSRGAAKFKAGDPVVAMSKTGYYVTKAAGVVYKKCSVDRSVVEAWLITKRQELHGEFSRNN